ncbi:GTP-binding protein [Hwangdonia lutea]|uniref:GTP-binding protein n=1 Tax=Hwangdonia lutea TaxID=3075823 RepID=A0AA97HQN2_9FLAO|nr:GTP-binding protein [Hwangdonia sp. SCSIO 19198]WOD44131.1 GTP-binding protein [Hwangdonia sp. SCSIO 19198]
MPVNNEIVLRPRFKMNLNQNNERLLKAFEDAKTTQKEFIISRIDDHVFIKLPKAKQQFWSPQLHLEINEVKDSSSKLHGLFGPNPTVWTMFMFLHFMVAGLFIAFGIWAYTNWNLEHDYAIQLSLMFLMVIVWFALYFAGSIGKASSKNEMHDLYDFMNRVLEENGVDLNQNP